jgi:hypothetical protein
MEVWHLFVILILAFLIKFFYNKWGRFPVPIKRKPNHSNLQPTIADDMRPKEDGKIKEKKAITPLQTIPLNNGEDNDVFVHWRISDMFEKRDTHPELYKIYETIRDFQYVESIFSPIKIINELRLIMRDYSEKPDYCLDKIKNEYINKNADSNYKYRQKHKETGRIIVECLKRLIIDKDCKFWWLFEQDRELKNNLSSEIQKVFFEKLDIKNQSDTELKK